jgi:peptide/nickel transport system substrate-binding protein
MDPAHFYSSDESMHMQAVYEPLVEIDSDFKPFPRLAVSWEGNSEATEWTFHLRQGVKFHNGKPFEAEDVVYTFRRVLDKDVGSPGRTFYAPMFDADGVEALDKRTVRFKLKKPTAEFPVLMRNKFDLMVPKGATGEELKTRGIGTGPFIVEQFAIGAPVRVLRRNPNYWMAGAPKADCLRMTVIQENVARTAALLSGGADLVIFMDWASAKTVKDNPKVTLSPSSAGARLYTIAMQVNTKPFDDVRVRQAMKLVVDRQMIVDTVFLGMAEAGNDNPVPPSSNLAFTREVMKRDVEKAKRLLTEAGYSRGLEVDMFTGDANPGMVAMAQAFAQMAAPAGIKVNVVTTPADAYWDSVWMKRPLFSGSYVIRPPQASLTIGYRSDHPWNETRWARPDYDALLDRASRTTDFKERVELHKQAQRLLATEGGAIIPAFIRQVSGLRAGCTGFQPHVTESIVDYRDFQCKD